MTEPQVTVILTIRKSTTQSAMLIKIKLWHDLKFSIYSVKLQYCVAHILQKNKQAFHNQKYRSIFCKISVLQSMNCTFSNL